MVHKMKQRSQVKSEERSNKVAKTKSKKKGLLAKCFKRKSDVHEEGEEFDNHLQKEVD